MKLLALFLSFTFLSGPAAEAKPVIQQWAKQSLAPYKWKNRILILKADSAENADLKKIKAEIVQKQKEIETRQLIIFEDVSLKAPERFQATLVGKDGEEKWRKTTGFTMDEVFTKIDSMPMRQQEMNQD